MNPKKTIYSVDDEEDEVHQNQSRNHQGGHFDERSITLRKKAARDPPMQITVKDKVSKSSLHYEVTNYKKGCDTCKTIRLNQSVNEER